MRLIEALEADEDTVLIEFSPDNGATWHVEGDFPGVPRYSYVAELEASQHDEDTVFATFTNHKQGDFKPYVFVSRDRGRTWTSITGDLPERGSVYALAEDPVDPDLLFAGTEFGVFFTVDGGERWHQLSGGVPTISPIPGTSRSIAATVSPFSSLPGVSGYRAYLSPTLSGRD